MYTAGKVQRLVEGGSLLKVPLDLKEPSRTNLTIKHFQ